MLHVDKKDAHRIIAFYSEVIFVLTKSHKVREGNRINSLDYLKAVGILGVVLLHVSANYIGKMPFYSCAWIYAVCCDGMGRFGVPVFIMTTGAVWCCLKKNIMWTEADIKKLWLTTIKKMIGVCIIGGFLHALYFSYLQKLLFYGYCLSFKEIVNTSVKLFSDGYMWYLDMLICLLIYLPVAVLISRNKAVEKYLRCITILFTLIPNTILKLYFLLADKTSNVFILLNGLFNRFYTNAEFHLGIAIIGLFLWGAYLYKLKFKWNKSLLWLMICVIYFITVGGGALGKLFNGEI